MNIVPLSTKFFLNFCTSISEEPMHCLKVQKQILKLFFVDRICSCSAFFLVENHLFKNTGCMQLFWHTNFRKAKKIVQANQNLRQETNGTISCKETMVFLLQLFVTVRIHHNIKSQQVSLIICYWSVPESDEICCYLASSGIGSWYVIGILPK